MTPLITAVAVSVSVACTNQNWTYSPRCTAPPVDINITHNGFYGTLESGVEWRQTWITPDLMVFEMENVKWITNGKTIVYLD